MKMQVHGVYLIKENIVADCYLCEYTLPIEQATPHIQWIINDKGKEPVIAFLCGTCDKRIRIVSTVKRLIDSLYEPNENPKTQ